MSAKRRMADVLRDRQATRARNRRDHARLNFIGAWLRGGSRRTVGYVSDRGFRLYRFQDDATKKYLQSTDLRHVIDMAREADWSKR